MKLLLSVLASLSQLWGDAFGNLFSHSAAWTKLKPWLASQWATLDQWRMGDWTDHLLFHPRVNSSDSYSTRHLTVSSRIKVHLPSNDQLDNKPLVHLSLPSCTLPRTLLLFLRITAPKLLSPCHSLFFFGRIHRL